MSLTDCACSARHLRGRDTASDTLTPRATRLKVPRVWIDSLSSRSSLVVQCASIAASSSSSSSCCDGSTCALALNSFLPGFLRRFEPPPSDSVPGVVVEVEAAAVEEELLEGAERGVARVEELLSDVALGVAGVCGSLELVSVGEVAESSVALAVVVVAPSTDARFGFCSCRGPESERARESARG